jgi:hypothetical protein
LPVLVVPGMHDEVIAIAVGYGRDKGVGKAAYAKDVKMGENVYPMVSKDAIGNANFYNYNVDIATTTEMYPLAITQTHHTYQADRPIIHEFTFDEFKKNPSELYDDRKHEFEHFTHSFDAPHEEHAEGGHAAEGHAVAAVGSRSN